MEMRRRIQVSSYAHNASGSRLSGCRQTFILFATHWERSHARFLHPRFATCPCRDPLLAHRQFAVELPDDPITFARRTFQLLSVQNLHGSVGVFDDAFSLQSARSKADTRAVGAEHGHE